jgi:hypothetical protein
MKKIFATASVLFILSCNQGKTPDEDIPAENSAAESVPPPPSDTTVMKFSDEEVWLSNLLSDKKDTRSAAFKKYLSVRDTSRNVSDLMRGYVKTYFSTYPNEFLSEYGGLKNREQEKIVDDIAHEFRAAGDDYKTDLDQYFEGITNSCTNCSADLLHALKSIKQKIDKRLTEHSTA